jgi:hypothetical protein
MPIGIGLPDAASSLCRSAKASVILDFKWDLCNYIVIFLRFFLYSLSARKFDAIRVDHTLWAEDDY